MHALGRFSEIERIRQEIITGLRRRLVDAGLLLTAEQALLLARLDDKPRTPGYLQTLAYFGSNIAYNLNALETDGYVTRRRSTEDLRRQLVEITESGRAVRTFVARELESWPQLASDRLLHRIAVA
jgi:DNA-binding MarR family transcriptional regulator